LRDRLIPKLLGLPEFSLTAKAGNGVPRGSRHRRLKDARADSVGLLATGLRKRCRERCQYQEEPPGEKTDKTGWASWAGTGTP
jgi:hypothetical protein